MYKIYFDARVISSAIAAHIMESETRNSAINSSANIFATRQDFSHFQLSFFSDKVTVVNLHRKFRKETILQCFNISITLRWERRYVKWWMKFFLLLNFLTHLCKESSSRSYLHIEIAGVYIFRSWMYQINNTSTLPTQQGNETKVFIIFWRFSHLNKL